MLKPTIMHVSQFSFQASVPKIFVSISPCESMTLPDMSGTRLTQYGKSSQIRILFMLLLALHLTSCSETSEAEAYQEVLATMSLGSAIHFLERYPRSDYATSLLNHVTSWCEDSEVDGPCHQVAGAISPDHPRGAELRARMEPHTKKSSDRREVLESIFG